MPTGLLRLYGQNHLHFITFCCYHRKPYLATPQARDLFLEVLSELRNKNNFLLVGYVVMPDHVHLLVSEPPQRSVSTVLQILKQRTSRLCRPANADPPPANAHQSNSPPFWQRRFFDFNVYTSAKLSEKLDYIHANPVEQRLVKDPTDWPWSSWSHYTTGKPTGPPIDPI